MLSRRLAKLLFCIALLAQIAAPVVGAAAMAGERGGRSAEICDPSLAAHARTATPDRGLRQIPSRETYSSRRLRVLPPRRRRAARLGDSLDGPAPNGVVPLRAARLGAKFYP